MNIFLLIAGAFILFAISKAESKSGTPVSILGVREPDSIAEIKARAQAEQAAAARAEEERMNAWLAAQESGLPISRPVSSSPPVTEAESEVTRVYAGEAPAVVIDPVSIFVAEKKRQVFNERLSNVV